MTKGASSISVVVPVSERFDPIMKLHSAYAESIANAGWNARFIYVLDGHFEDVRRDLEDLINRREELAIVQLGKTFGESTALSAGFEQCHTDWILTLPAYNQVAPESIGLLLAKAGDADMLLAKRWPRFDSSVNRAMTRLFHRIVRTLTGTRLSDLGCGVRLMHKKVTEEIPVYGDQHRFLPILAENRGFSVQEVELPQSTEEKFRRVPSPGVYPRRLLDLLSVFFLVKFTKKPLRFFGLLGSATLGVGIASVLWLSVQRVIFEVPLAERPALLLASLLVVLGVQLLAIGLVGEIVIFTHANKMKEYTIAEIVNEDVSDSA